jgi:hypothetical protein
MRVPPLGRDDRPARIEVSSKEVERMSQRFGSLKHLIYTAATLATLLLAAGARWKPSSKG